ncbi:MAG: flagellar motor protein MotB [Fidelibacterota bacterium]
MPRKPQPPPPEPGLPNWFATFADMMTLLLAFFVLLAAISTIDPVKLQAMADSMKKSVGKKIEMEGAMSLADIEKAVKVMVSQEQMEEAVEVTTSTKGVTIGISSDISFESGSADLKPGIMPILEKIVPTIENSYFQVAVEGHTDNVPISDNIRVRFPSNWELSGARAASVVRELIDMGVEPTRLQSVGYAEYIPRDRPTDRLITDELILELNATPDLQARNRRVEITFLAPRGGPVGSHREESEPEEGGE